MQSILLSSLLMIFIIQFLISSYFVSRILLLYKDLSSLQLMFVVILSNLAILTSLLYYNSGLLAVNEATLSFKIALFAIIMIIIMVAVFLDKTIYASLTRALSKSSFFVFCIVIGIILSEFITGQNNFFYLKVVLGQYVPHYELTPSILIIIGGLLILIAIYLSYKDMLEISEALVSKNSFYLIMISSALMFSAFLINLVLQTVSPELLVNNPLFNKDLIYFMYFTSLNLLSFSFAFFSYSQPFLNLTGSRPDLLIKRGLLGYYLASHTDNGPEPLIYSEEFVKNSNMKESSLLALAVSSIILIGMFREENSTFISKVSLIPIPDMENHSALVYSFLSKSKTIKDERIRDKTPCIFAILFPSNLSIAIRNMQNTLNVVLEYFYKYTSIEELNEPQQLLILTSTILRKILL